MRCKIFLIALFLIFLIEFVPAPFLDSAYWDRTEANEGEPVNLIVEGRGLIGHPISFEIYERNEGGTDTLVPNPPANIIFLEGEPSDHITHIDYAPWNAVFQDDDSPGETNPPEYYFIAQIADKEPTQFSRKSSSTVWEEMLKVYREPIDSGTIWTTKGNCGDAAQDVNNFAIGEVVYVNGAGFAQGVYPWGITGGSGGSSADPGITIASGTQAVGESGSFCFRAYTIAGDDWGEYNINFDDKSDNYRVNPTDPENECQLNQAYWEVTSAFEGEEVKLIIQGTEECAGQEISFVVKEEDTFPNGDDDVKIEPSNIIFDSSVLNYAYWIAEGQDNDDSDFGESYPPEYFFTAKIISKDEELKSSNLLEVLNRDVACSGTEYCRDYKNKIECEADRCEVGKDSISSQIICGESFNPITQCWDNTNCGCFWDISSESCDGGWEVESKCSCNTDDECWLLRDHCKEDCTCEDGYESNYDGTCGDDNPNVCVPYEDECWLVRGHCNEDDCTCEDGYESNYDGTCGDQYLSPGTCRYTDISEDTCEDDGLLVRIQNALWVWAPGNEVSRDDPLDINLRCNKIEEIFVCPESVEVPFFGFYNLIAAITVIILIYLGSFLYNKNKK